MSGQAPTPQKKGWSLQVLSPSCNLQLQFSLFKSDTSGGEFLSGFLRRVRLTGVKMTGINFRAVGTCPGYSESGLTYVRLNEGEL